MTVGTADPRNARKDRRKGEAWTARQRLKNDLVWAVARAALRGARPLSLARLRWLGRALGSAAYFLAANARRTALDNVARVLPQLTHGARRSLVRRCFATLGEYLGETTALLRELDRPPCLPVAPASLAIVDRARDEGHGVVFVSAHLGPWERVAASLVQARVPLIALARESYDARFSNLYARLRALSGVRVIWRSERHAASKILRALRKGDVLGVTMDLRSRVPSCSAPFLGHPAATAVGPARIALRARAAVIVGSAEPTSHGQSDTGGSGPLVVTAVRIRTDDLTACAAGALVLTERINAELARRILAMPHAWVWMHPRWSPLQVYDGVGKQRFFEGKHDAGRTNAKTGARTP